MSTHKAHYQIFKLQFGSLEELCMCQQGFLKFEPNARVYDPKLKPRSDLQGLFIASETVADFDLKL